LHCAAFVVGLSARIEFFYSQDNEVAFIISFSRSLSSMGMGALQIVIPSITSEPI
jgi:hypothetical protein